MEKDNKLLNTREVTGVLGVSLITVYSYIASKKLKAHKLGGNGKSKRHYRIWQKDLEAFIAGDTAGAGEVQTALKLKNKRGRK